MSSRFNINSSDTKALLGPSERQYITRFHGLNTTSQSICHFLLFYVGRRAFLQVAGDNDTIHPQSMYLPKDNSLD